MTDVTEPAALRLAGITKSYGTTKVLHGIDLAVPRGAFTVFVGPSGCGKSTLLRIIAGLERQDGGTVAINGRPVDNVPPARRDIAMVFQSYALYPHLDVAGNMGLALKQAGASKAEREARVAEAARMLALEPLLARRPAELSGGQRQRVAIGRAIVRQPALFLFDEPLSNLDAALRIRTRLEIARLHHTLAAGEAAPAMVYVTHDQTEAMTLADTIVVLDAGRIAQVGSPMALYNAPADLFVARFIGSPAMNVVTTPAETLGIRPEHVTLARDGGDWRGTVAHVEHLGADTYVHVDLAPDGPDSGGEPVAVRLGGQADYRAGEAVGLTPQRDQLHRFDAEGRRKPA